MKNLRLTEEQYAKRQKKFSEKASPKPSKYKNVRTNGFDSRKEFERYMELLLLEKAGEIRHLQTQVGFELHVNDIVIGRYVADFLYYENSRKVVEDCKGVLTPVYRLKKKLMLAIYGIEIKET